MRPFYIKTAAATAAVLLTITLAACGADTAASATPNTGGARAGSGGGQGGGQGGGPGGGGPGGFRGGPGGGGGQPQPVEIAVIERVTLARTSSVAGQLSPLRVVGVTSQAAGALLRVTVEEGSRVQRGQLLAELDSRELEAQLRAARANQSVARATLARSEQLRANQVITAAEFERDQAAVISSDASVSQLETRLGFTKIVAPIDGVVTQRFVQTGDIVGGATRLFTVADVSTLVTQLPVSELEVPFLRQGSIVTVRVDALNRDVQGRIRRIFPSADSVSRLVPVEVAISGAQQAGLKPGYSVRVTLNLDERNDALVVPTRAVVGAAGSQSVFVIREGKAERRRIRVGTDLDGQMEVFEGLAAGDTIITTGSAFLRDGASVRVVDPLVPETAAPARTVPATTPSTTPAPGARP